MLLNEPRHTTPRRALGLTVSVLVDDPGLSASVEAAFADLPSAPDADHRIVVDAVEDRLRVRSVTSTGEVELLGERTDRPSVLELVVWDVNRRALRTRASTPVLHGAVVAGPRGAVVLCGASGQGKSTLAAAAAQRGWTHLSDDLAPIDAVLSTVEPYARPIMLRPGGRALLGLDHDGAADGSSESFVTASSLGALVAQDAVPLCAVVVLTWSESARLDRVSRARLLHEMAAQCATLPGSEACFDDLVTVARTIPGFELGLGSVPDALDLIAPLVGR